jgi:hypothetical protein
MRISVNIKRLKDKKKPNSLLELFGLKKDYSAS